MAVCNDLQSIGELNTNAPGTGTCRPREDPATLAESLRERLAEGGFDWDQPTMFSWLGVTPYLSVDAIEETLRTMSSCAPGSEVVFTYAPPQILLDEDDRESVAIVAREAERSTEPLRSFFVPEEIVEIVARCGLHVADHADRDDLIRRYFADRGDGLEPWGVAHIVAAVVPLPR